MLSRPRIRAVTWAVPFLLCVPGCTGFFSPRDFSSFRQPSEFEPTEVVWISAEPGNPEFMKVTAEMIEALRPHVRVKVLLRDDESATRTRAILAERGIDVASLEFFVYPGSRFFIRDGAVHLVDDRGHLAMLDLKWSLYGLPGWMARLNPSDPEAASKAAEYIDPVEDQIERWFAHEANVPVLTSTLFLERSMFETNGRGLLVISEPVALERNPGLTRDQIERGLLEIPGMKKVIWLAGGLAQDPLEMSTIVGPYVGLGTDGHADEYVRFADPNTVLLASVDEDRVGEHPVNRINHNTMQKNYDILKGSTDQDNRPLRVVKIPMPNVIERPIVLAGNTDTTTNWLVGNFPASEGRQAGDEVIQVAAASYLNLLIANDLVLVPSYVEDGTPTTVQDRVRRELQDAFPGRTVQFIHATPLNWDGGGPHCATLSQPRAD